MKDYEGIYKKKNFNKINKNTIFNNYIRYMFGKTNHMFSYGNLPETISRRQIELYTQYDGWSCFADWKNDLYIYQGALGGAPDENNLPTECIISNPFQRNNKIYKINKDCIIMKNDEMYYGLYPLFEQYAALLTENYVSIRSADINSRIVSLLTAKNEQQKQSAELYYKKIIDGDLSVIMDNMSILGDGVDVKNYTIGNGNKITDLIELHQYIWSQWNNELGLQSNYNMKRESINSNEAILNRDTLYPLVDEMYACRKEAIEKVNKMFGTHITVEFDGIWKQNQIELESSEKMLKKEGEINDIQDDK